MSKIVYRASAPGETWDRPLTSPTCDNPQEAKMWFFGHYPNKRSCIVTNYIDYVDGSGMIFYQFGCVTFKKVTKKTVFEADPQSEERTWRRVAA